MRTRYFFYVWAETHTGDTRYWCGKKHRWTKFENMKKSYATHSRAVSAVGQLTRDNKCWSEFDGIHISREEF